MVTVTGVRACLLQRANVSRSRSCSRHGRWLLLHWKVHRRLSSEANAALASFEYFGGDPQGVNVYENSSGSMRKIVAETTVAAPVDVTWRVITEYEALPSFVPNLDVCERLPCEKANRTILRQVACSQSALWRIEAEAILEVEEIVGKLGHREIRFSMVSGDFVKLGGRWIVEPDHSSATGMASVLRYELSVQPAHLLLPPSVVSFIIRTGLPANIKALVQRAEQITVQKLKATGLAFWAGMEEDPPIKASLQDPDISFLPAKGPFWPLGSRYEAAAPLTAEAQRRRAAALLLGVGEESPYLGITSVPVPASGLGVGQSIGPRAQDYFDMQLKDKERQNVYPSFGLLQTSSKVAVDDDRQNKVALPVEVHLRRLDGLDYLHRRAVAAITIDASPKAVWDILTDYNHLAEFIPNLVESQRIRLPAGAPPNVVRIRQVGYKHIMYMRLHAETILDLIEKAYSEIQFRQVAGDFDQFQGKWMIQEAPADPQMPKSRRQTQLKYAVEVVLPRSATLLGLLEPVLEKMVFEDIPANLVALKRRVEVASREGEIATLESQGQIGRAAALRRQLEGRPRLADMVEDFELLKVELELCFGDQRAIPSRKALREMNRTDIEKAMAAHGGPRKVADAMGWTPSSRRKPRGYWSSLANVKREVDGFIAASGMDPGMMPLKNDFVRAERFDLARAVERWGGLYALADALGYGVASPTSTRSEWSEHISEVAAETGLSGKQGLFQLASRTYRRKSDEKGGTSKQRADYSTMSSVRKEIDTW